MALCLASCVEVVFVGERSCVLLVYITQIFSGGSLCGKSCVDDLVEILLCEDGGVEQWLEPRNISLCLRLIHYLKTLSLLNFALYYFILFISYLYAWYCLCAILVLNCNAPIRRVRRRYCDVCTQVENTLTYIR